MIWINIHLDSKAAEGGMHAHGGGVTGGAGPGPPGAAAARERTSTLRLRLTTGRRLLFAFAAIVCAFGAVLVFTTHRLHAIETVLDGMRRHQERLRLALELESALRDTVGQQVLDRRIDAALAAGEHGVAPGENGVAPGERGHALTMHMEERLDRLCTREHAAAIALRALASDIERSALRWIIAFAAGAALVAGAVGWHIHRSVARPMARLAEGAARLARGELGTSIHIDSPDELGVLAGQFNAMSAALLSNQEKLVHSEKLAFVGRLAAGFAHELNNPLSVILGYVMIHRRRSDGRLARDLEAVEQEALRAREMVQDLLELSRPDRVRGALPVDLGGLCDEVVTDLCAVGHLASSRVAVTGEGIALGSRAKLRQILVNLVRNAAEAAGAGGEVDVCVRAAEGVAEVAVSDSGAGVAPDARDRLFEPFFTTKPTGTGLGLAVSRAIARAHGGDIALAERRGGGACFTLTVPLAPQGSHSCQAASWSSTTEPASPTSSPPSSLATT